jgi:hypothetical protein
MPFDMGKALGWATVTLATGTATFDPLGAVLLKDHAIPRKILFQSGGGPRPWLKMGIELVDGRPECTYLEFDSDEASPVRDKHLKLVHIEEMVGQIVAACAQPVERTPRGIRITYGLPSPEQVKTVGRMQRRRRDPDDRELLEAVATIYREHPDAPVAAIMRAMGMSRRTAGRWAARCSEVGLLPHVDTKGKKRL